MARLLVKGLARAGLLRPAFRLRERIRAAEGPKVPPTAPDGLPLPRRLMMVRVAGHADWRQFYESGEAQARAFAEVAEAAGLPFGEAGVVLDWGCGCGRVSRHLSKHTQAKIVGRDPDAMTVGWCAANLPGDYRVCSPQPPLDLGEASVDAAISLSVFTHLTLPQQKLWLAELARVIRPGGALLLTFMDEAHHNAWRLGAARAELERDGFAVTTTELEGTNHMGTFQTRAQLTELAAPWFEARTARGSQETALQQAVIGFRRR